MKVEKTLLENDWIKRSFKVEQIIYILDDLIKRKDKSMTYFQNKTKACH